MLATAQVAFIKNFGYRYRLYYHTNTVESISSTGDFELSLDILEGNYIAQMGFHYVWNQCKS